MVKSFTIDHTQMKAPDIRIADEIQVGRQHRIVKYDIRFKKPYQDEPMYPAAMHSIEHMMATAIREISQCQIIDFSPMGCRTGFYLTVLDPTDNFVSNDIKGAMIVSLDMDEVPGSDKKSCGNYHYHDIDEAKRELLDFLEFYYGIRLILR